MRRKNPASESKPIFQFVPKTKDLPATQGMLQLVRTELKADIRGLESKMKSGFKQVDSRFDQMEARFNKIDSQFSQTDSKFSQLDSKFSQIDSKFSQIDSKFSQIDSRFNQVDSRFNQIDSRFDQMDSKFEQVLAEVSRIGVLVEEQNSRNNIVMEGLSGLWHRQQRVETRVDEIEKLVRSIAHSRT